MSLTRSSIGGSSSMRSSARPLIAWRSDSRPPRRFGKTSLLDAHIASMRAVGHRAVRIDLSKVANVGDVAARVAESFSVLPTDPRRSVRRWAARLGVTAKLAGVQLSIAPSAARPGADEARAALLELLDVPLGLHQADGGVTIVCLDEFQDLLVADDALDGLFRSVIQHHAAAAAYVFAGSQPSLMRALFSERERPFYGQARPLELPPLPVDETARASARRRPSANRQPGRGRTPNRSQHSARRARTPARRRAQCPTRRPRSTIRARPPLRRVAQTPLSKRSARRPLVSIG